MLDGKNIAVLAGEPIDDCAVEIIEIIRAMKGMNARIRVVSSPRKRIIRGKTGAVGVNISIDKARAEDFDAVIICTDCHCDDSDAHLYCADFLREVAAQGKLIGAINKGIKLVVSSGLLPDEFLSLPLDVDSLGTDGPWPDDMVIRKDNLIIASHSIKLMSFVQEIVSALRGDTIGLVRISPTSMEKREKEHIAINPWPLSNN